MPITNCSVQVKKPIITIDGPSGAGKGTIATKLAEHLGYHFLDSGALYRIVGLMAEKAGFFTNSEQLINEDNLVHLTQSLQITFLPTNSVLSHIVVIVNNEDVTHAIRTEQVGEYASKIAVFPKVRQALLDLQRNMATETGLVADGRDMGTVVFPEAIVKIFLTASAVARAERRVTQLQQMGKPANYDEILAQIIARDERDSTRDVSPSKPATDAVVIDSSHLDIETVFTQVLQVCKEKGLVS